MKERPDLLHWPAQESHFNAMMPMEYSMPGDPMVTSSHLHDHTDFFDQCKVSGSSRTRGCSYIIFELTWSPFGSSNLPRGRAACSLTLTGLICPAELGRHEDMYPGYQHRHRPYHGLAVVVTSSDLPGHFKSTCRALSLTMNEAGRHETGPRQTYAVHNRITLYIVAEQWLTRCDADGSAVPQVQTFCLSSA